MMNNERFSYFLDLVISKWQEICNLIAKLLKVPSALIMKIENEDMDIFLSSQSENNPYHVGDNESGAALYCESVIKSKSPIKIANSLNDPFWNKNPDIQLGMIAYMGFPINFADGTPFGTICILDTKENNFS
jgi:GAF domain-containing protein